MRLSAVEELKQYIFQKDKLALIRRAAALLASVMAA